MLNNGTGAVQSLLTVGRIAARTLITGAYARTDSEASCSNGGDAPKSKPTVGGVKQLLQHHLTARTALCQRQQHTTTNASVKCSDGEQTSNGGSASRTTTAKQRFVAVCCGFPKDLIFGPSANREKYVIGDDACFIAQHRQADVVGVADGVGGWRSYGIDPSVFSRSLMEKCKELVDSGNFEPQQPAKLLAAAFAQLYKRRLEEIDMADDELNSQPVIGSSTACVVVLDRDSSLLHTANLGDSGFLVIRKGKVVHRSEEQCHYFNAPFQLALPPNIDRPINFLSDSPDAADVSSFMVEEGDLVLLATDGLFDNLPTELIESELSTRVPSSTVETANEALELRLQEMCNTVALMARRRAFDQQYNSPFAAKARQHGITDCMGGKPDDITVVLVLVTRVP